MKTPKWTTRSIPHWRIQQARADATKGRWAVLHDGTYCRRYFAAWPDAAKYTLRQISRWAIADVIRRAVEVPGEYEAIEACLIQGEGLAHKRRLIYDYARLTGLSVSIASEEEDDPRDTLILVRYSGKKKGNI